jgi:DNA-binding protein YbaB
VIFVGVGGGVVPNLNDASDIGGHGTARNGLVRISLSASGLVETVKMDPRVRRLESHDLAASVHEALLAAQHDLLRQAEGRNAALDAEAERLDKKLAEIDAQYLSQMEAFRQVMDDLTRRTVE